MGQAARIRIFLQEIQQERQRREAVQLDALICVTIHAFLNGFSGIVQPALDSSLGGFQSSGDVFYTHFIVVVHQHAQPLGFRQRIYQFHDHPPGLLIVQRFIRNRLLVQIFVRIQQAVALFVLWDLVFAGPAGQQVFAAVRSHLVQPAPKRRWFLQIVDPFQHGNQNILSCVQCILFIFQHLPAVKVDAVLYFQNQRLLRLTVSPLAAPDQR